MDSLKARKYIYYTFAQDKYKKIHCMDGLGVIYKITIH